MSLYQKGVRPVEPTKTLELLEDENPEFKIPKDPNWYMRVHYVHYAGYFYDDYYIRAHYSVVATYA